MVYLSVYKDYNDRCCVGSDFLGSDYMLSESKGKWIICILL